jgi:hypothetical protein
MKFVFAILLLGLIVNPGLGMEPLSSPAESDHPVAQCRVEWNASPKRVPSRTSVDAPLLGNGDMGGCVGALNDGLRYYLAKNDFWRLVSKYNESGPRPVGTLSITADGLAGKEWNLIQELHHPRLHGTIGGETGLRVEAWIAASENVLVVRVESPERDRSVRILLEGGGGGLSEEDDGQEKGVRWVERRYEKGVDIHTAVTAAMRVEGGSLDGETVDLPRGKPVTFLISMQSRFKAKDQRAEAIRMCRSAETDVLWKKHVTWWEAYWNRSRVLIGDSDLLRLYYLSLYTMGAASRDPGFPPGIFGIWVTTDRALWNGDYHLNYNHQAPFYALVGSNRLEQAFPHDAPLLDFLERGKGYAEAIHDTRGVLCPVGIGPKGIDTTYDSHKYEYPKKEKRALTFGQRSNAAYAVANMARYWRGTHDPSYAKRVYPFIREVAFFWENYLKFEEGRYVIHNDSIHETSGENFNSIVSLALVRNALEVALEMGAELDQDRDHFEKWNHILRHLSGFALQEREGRRVFRYTERGPDWWKNNTLGIQHIYPGNAVGPDSPGELLETARNTLEVMGRWMDYNGTSSFYPAAVRAGLDSETILQRLCRYASRTWPNGLQRGNPHAIENCSTVPNTINEMLCMGHGNVLRVFPVWPEGRPARFENLRTWGAFLVSSSRDADGVKYVRLHSERGREAVMINPWPGKKAVLHRKGGKSEILSGNRIRFPTKAGETIWLGVEGASVELLRSRFSRKMK